ncbi:hypothetical protein AB4212_32745, partial [Streptomyces sp. 2MCAF27]
LLDHTLAGAPLGGRWGGDLAGPHGAVYLTLFALIAAVAGWTYLRARKAAVGRPAPAGVPAGAARLLPLMSFGTLVTAAVVPLAAGLYLATSTTWTAVERAQLQRTGREEKVKGGARSSG